jgi:hypothetical protein
VHTTIPLRVWVDVDLGIAEMVRRLNEITGIRTHASCQGTLGEGGAHPYRPYVQVSWFDAAALALLEREFDVTVEGACHGKAHPRAMNRRPKDGSNGGIKRSPCDNSRK